MPTPVACLLNNPEMTLSRDRSGDNGSRLLLSSMSAPAPLAHQFGGLMPLPMNRAANRLGCSAADDSLPPNDIASSQGRPMVTPTPVRNVRRLSLFDRSVIESTSEPQQGVDTRYCTLSVRSH